MDQYQTDMGIDIIVDFIVFTKDAGSDSIEARVQIFLLN